MQAKYQMKAFWGRENRLLETIEGPCNLQVSRIQVLDQSLVIWSINLDNHPGGRSVIKWTTRELSPTKQICIQCQVLAKYHLYIHGARLIIRTQRLPTKWSTNRILKSQKSSFTRDIRRQKRLQLIHWPIFEHRKWLPPAWLLNLSQLRL